MDRAATSLPDWLAREYPFSPGEFVTPSGARMRYLDQGPKRDEAVLMLHGNPTWSFYYRRLVSALSPQFRCIVPDHVGMGLSDKPANYAYTLATRITDIEALVASLRLRRVHLVLHDWGGAIGMGFAERHPEMIGRIVVLNTAAFAADRIPARIALCKLPVLGPALVRGLNGFAGPATWMAMHRRRLTAAERQGYLYPYRNWHDRIAVSEFVRDIPMSAAHPTWPVLQRVEAGLPKFADRRALIVWGGRDFCFNDTFLARWQAIWPQAEVRRLADAGHYVLEDAAAEVVPVVTTFLTAP